MKKLLLSSSLACMLGMGAVSDAMAASKNETKTYSNASDNAYLLELYTSQGCSSCPPAERWLSNFKYDQRLWKSVFPLAFHVDYWDYIGWKDVYAQKKFGKRQRLYQYLGNIRQVATPGFVYGGKGWNGWFRGQKLTAGKPFSTEGQLELALTGNKVSANYLISRPSESLSQSFKINVAILGFDLISEITDGENEGRHLSQDFVVLNMQSTFMNDGKSANKQTPWTAEMLLPKQSIQVQAEAKNEKQALVAWVSYGENPAPVQVAGGWL